MCNLSQALVEQGVQQGEEKFEQLLKKLYALGREGDVKRVTEDKVYRHTLMKELL